MIIAIDGPSGSGKSSVSSLVSNKLNFCHIDTGAMFRAITYLAIKNDVDVNDEQALVKLIDNQPISYVKDGEVFKIFVDNVDISDKLRNPMIDKNVTPVCKHKMVRQAMLDLQRNIAKKGNYILDGRDIGTVVFPDAEYKFFLVADVRSRAKRRLLDYQNSKKDEIDYEKILQDINRRDYEDIHREHAPLKKADDAIEIDTTNFTLEEVVDKVVSYINL